MTPYELVKQHYKLPFEGYPFQVDVINNLAPNDQAGYYAEVGCVDSETEYLSPTGWKKISTYSGGMVAQYTPGKNIEFVTPLSFLKKPCAEMYHFKTTYGMDQMLSPEHRVLVRNHRTGEHEIWSAERIAKYHWSHKCGFRHKFETTFEGPNLEGLDVTVEQLRVMVAVIADGSFYTESSRCVINIKKWRKKERLAGLLFAAGIDFKIQVPPSSAELGYARFVFDAPWRLKHFDCRFYSCSNEQLQVIADEVLHWDGSDTGHRARFSSYNLESADFVQYALAASGVRSTLTSLRRHRRGTVEVEHCVHLYHKTNLACMDGSGVTKDTRVTLAPSTDGFKYCFEVPSSFLVFRRGGRVFTSGNTGKTFMSTVSTLYQRVQYRTKHTIIIVPPILTLTWTKWLDQISGIEYVVYAGTPAKRKEINLDRPFIIVSLGIFKRDFDRFVQEFDHKPISVIVDEATSIKNVGSDNHKKVHQFTSRPDCYLMLLTGTPLSTPIDAYAYVKMIAPGTYRSLHQFENLHSGKRDFFGNIVEWRNLELMQENLALNSTRVRKEDVLKDLPEVTYQPIFYELSKEHQALYKKVVDERLILLKESNKKIDVTEASALYHALQQLILGYAHFSGNPDARPAGYDVLDEVLQELGGKKLMVFSTYRRTNRDLLEYLKPYGAVGAYGDLTPTQSSANFEKFISDTNCQVFVANVTAAGTGLDGAQRVCSDMLFLECPIIPKDFRQAVGRLHRTGAAANVHVRVAVAQGTVQQKLLKNMLAKDEITAFVQRDFATIRGDLFGGD